MDTQQAYELQADVVTAHRSTYAACMTFVVLEYIQHFELERTLVWRSKWNLCKCLFLVARYLPLGVAAAWVYYISSPDSPSEEACTMIFSILAVSMVVTCLCADAVLYIRVYALSGQSGAMRMILTAHYVVIALASLTGIGMVVRGGTASPPIKLSGLTACASIPSLADNGWAIVLYSLLLYNAAFTMLLSLWFGVKLFCSVQPKPSPSLLVRIFYVDGALYFAAITAISIANIVVSIHAPRQYCLTLAVPQTAVHAVLAARMIIQLREVAGVQSVEPNASFRLGEGVAGSKPWGVTGTLSAFRATSDAGGEEWSIRRE
ncbi:hypothetical protein BKA70DRAFT_1559516 [Coprinopsis sp. MPI-PUGE-AT-0042]|nr:hypothetical protein BKA70DRAFT_1559516 [Coprinopsis sp. MPI-PUGE-AT-0042]